LAPPVTSAEIRRRFLDFFAQRGHTVVPSSSLVPAGDPTLLFTNAGMVQFKDVFLGLEARPYRRAVTAQKAVRAGGKHNDLDEVGRTARHHTFFEMLGNFSFGDYFKREAIDYAWTFLTRELGLDPSRLWVTVYEEDDEARALWQEVASVPADRIVGLGAKDNFWQMADTGPCGPCSEVHIDRGEAYRCAAPVCAVGVCGCDRWLELWNLVFMQFDRAPNGTLSPLPRPSIDTGMGLERIASILQGVDSNYDTDLFTPLIRALEGMTGRPYDRGPGGFAFRVLADHARSATFLVADGVLPANEGRGYVLRRIMRRAIRIAREVGDGHELSRLVPVVAEVMGAAYPEVRDGAIADQVRAEEDRFLATLDAGNARFEEVAARAHDGVVRGEDVFQLYDTFGFPPDLTEELAQARGLRVDRTGFEAAMARQRERARRARAGAGGAFAPEQVTAYPESRFVGYERLEATAEVVAVWDAHGPADRLEAGERGRVLLDPTPFYAEGGGQVGDRGVLAGLDTEAVVWDTQKTAGRHLSEVEVVRGALRPGDRVLARVDRARREGAMRNHTGTHILHQALREVLGSHVRQTGSLVAPDRLRFDFAHPRPLTADEIEAVEDLCNETILADLEVTISQHPIEEARRLGALMFFDEKYGDLVRVVSVGDFSRELCGGTHCRRSGQIGGLKIVSETGIGAGVRRVEAVTGLGVLAYTRALEGTRRAVAEALGARAGEEEAKARQLREELEEAREALARAERERLGREAARLAAGAERWGALTLAAGEVEVASAADLRAVVDAWREAGPDGVLVAGGRRGDWAGLVVAVAGAAQGRVDAGALVRDALAEVGGRGGGQPRLGQGGVSDPERLSQALAAAVGRARALLRAPTAVGGEGKGARRAE
jgi:alanyl-tRNA synthetase